MKKIFLLATIAITLILFSCKKENKETSENLCPVIAASAVPRAVLDSFVVKYPSTIVITWFYKDNSSYCAYFKTATNVEILAEFTSTGSFIKQKIESEHGNEGEDSTSTSGGKTTKGCECETHQKD